MTKKEVSDRLLNIKVWKRKDVRAPHKPMLILIALGKAFQGKDRMILYKDIHGILEYMLRDYGPPVQKIHPEFPFWRMQKDGIWELSLESKEVSERKGGDVSPGNLISLGVAGGFTEEIDLFLSNNPGNIPEIARDILNAHFPESYHEELLQIVGIDSVNTSITSKKKRDPMFRKNVLKAYANQCAVCGLSIQLDRALIGLEAAHIQWHTHSGPDIVQNGLALCATHHILYDRGVFTVRPDKVLLASEWVTGLEGLDDVLLRYHNKNIRETVRKEYAPESQYLEWHRMNVFHGLGRD